MEEKVNTRNERILVSILISILFLSGKALVGLYVNHYGFLCTAGGSALTAYKYAKLDKKFLLAWLETLSIGIFIYAFWKWTGKIENLTETQGFLLITGTIVLSTVCMGRIGHNWFHVKQGLLEVILENISIIAFVLGTALIIYKINLGWLIFVIAHFSLGTMQLVQKEKDYFFALLQLTLLIMSLMALLK